MQVAALSECTDDNAPEQMDMEAAFAGKSIWDSVAPSFLTPEIPGESIEERFMAFHQADPWIYEA